MDNAAVHYSSLQLPDVIKEIYQVILLDQKAKVKHKCPKQYPLRISFCLRSKRHTNQEGIKIFSVRVACNRSVQFIPLLEEKCLELTSHLICTMQSQEQESHLVIQEVDEKDDKIRKTSVLWLDSDAETSTVGVSVLKDSIKYTESQDDGLSVLQIRVFLKMDAVILFGKEICDLIKSIKLLNPMIQLSFTMKIGGVAEVELYNTDCIRCDTLNIYSGTYVFLGKYATHVVCDTPQIRTSETIELHVQGPDKLQSVIFLRAIAWFVPMFLTGDENEAKCLSQHHYIPGQLSVQVFGPDGIPYDMNIVSKTLSFDPGSLCEWSKFGFQVKTAFKHSAYNLNSSARILDKDNLPSWTAKCQRFCLMLAFVVSQSVEPCTDHVSIKSQLNLFKRLEEQISGKLVLSKFREAADSCLNNLFLQDDPSCQNDGVLEQEKASTYLFRNTIVDIANSLTDIFTRSSDADFRSEVSSLLPTSSRLSMTTYLMKALWELTPTSKYEQENPPLPPDMLSCNADESEVDNWDNSQDSLNSEAQKVKSMSPDSLDLEHEWEEVFSNIQLNQCTDEPMSTTSSNSIESPYTFEGSIHNYNFCCPDKSVLNSMCTKEILPHNTERNVYDEREHETWHHLRDHSSHYCETNNDNQISACFSTQFVKPCGEEVKYNMPCVSDQHLSFSEEDILDKQFKQFLTEENNGLLTNESNISNDIAGLKNNIRSDSVKGFPRKRSSEYLNDTVGDDICFSASPTFQEKESEVQYYGQEINKRQRFHHNETSVCCEWRPPLLEFLPKEHVPLADQHNAHKEQTVCDNFVEGNEIREDSGLRHRKEGEDGDWFDEDEIANWYAEMNM